MSGTPETDIVSSVRTTFGPRLLVRELQAARRVAAVTIFTDETAASVVAGPDLPSDRDFEVASPLTSWRGLSGLRLKCLRLPGSRLGSDARFALVDLDQQRVERAFEDRGHVPFGELVGQ